MKIFEKKVILLSLLTCPSRLSVKTIMSNPKSFNRFLSRQLAKTIIIFCAFLVSLHGCFVDSLWFELLGSLAMCSTALASETPMSLINSTLSVQVG